jgi:Ankyrin repeats (3 copies)
VADFSGELPLHTAVLMRLPANLVQLMCRERPATLQVGTWIGGRLPIHLAAEKRSLEMARLLTSEWRAGLREQSRWGWTPLVHGIFENSFEVVQFLVDADPATVRAADHEGWLPLHLAAEGASLRIVQLLADRHPQALREIPAHGGFLPLHLALRQNREAPIVQFLALAWTGALRQPFDGGDDDANDDTGHLPLHRAVQNHYPLEVIRALVHAEPRALSVPSSDGSVQRRVPPCARGLFRSGCGHEPERWDDRVPRPRGAGLPFRIRPDRPASDLPVDVIYMLGRPVPAAALVPHSQSRSSTLAVGTAANARTKLQSHERPVFLYTRWARSWPARKQYAFCHLRTPRARTAIDTGGAAPGDIEEKAPLSLTEKSISLTDGELWYTSNSIRYAQE